jgi:hypothetical protein
VNLKRCKFGFNDTREIGGKIAQDGDVTDLRRPCRGAKRCAAASNNNDGDLPGSGRLVKTKKKGRNKTLGFVTQAERTRQLVTKVGFDRCLSAGIYLF